MRARRRRTRRVRPCWTLPGAELVASESSVPGTPLALQAPGRHGCRIHAGQTKLTFRSHWPNRGTWQWADTPPARSCSPPPEHRCPASGSASPGSTPPPGEFPTVSGQQRSVGPRLGDARPSSAPHLSGAAGAQRHARGVAAARQLPACRPWSARSGGWPAARLAASPTRQHGSRGSRTPSGPSTCPGRSPLWLLGAAARGRRPAPCWGSCWPG